MGSMLSFSGPHLVSLFKMCYWKVLKALPRTDFLIPDSSFEREPRAFVARLPQCSTWGHCEPNSGFYSILKIACDPWRCQEVAGSLTDRSGGSVSPSSAPRQEALSCLYSGHQAHRLCLVVFSGGQCDRPAGGGDSA